jgi:DNA-binding GntR family transcriptional regulator
MASNRARRSENLHGAAAAEGETQTSQAVAAILRMIERLELAPGSTFTERALGETLGLGKAPVREALVRITGTGLISPRTGSGYVVAPITLREARSLFDLWRCLEHLAVECYRSPAVVAAATRVPLSEHWESKEGDGKDEHLAAMFFHVGVATLSGNEPLARALPHWEVSRLLRFADGLVGKVACAPETHRDLWDALLDSDIERAAGISAAHIDDLKHRVLDGLSTVDQIQDMKLVRPTSREHR